MGKRTLKDSIINLIDSSAEAVSQPSFWAVGQVKRPPKIHLTQINNYFVQENGKPKLIKREVYDEEGELLAEEECDNN